MNKHQCYTYKYSSRKQSSSYSLACPVTWGRRYSWLASFAILSCRMRCALSTPPLSCLSYTNLSILGSAALFFFCLLCLHLAFFHSPHMAVPLQSFSVISLDACTTLVVPPMCSFRILSLLVTLHIHLSILISFTSSRASCPLVVAQVSASFNRTVLTTVFVNLSLQFHWHPPVTQHSTASLRVSP